MQNLGYILTNQHRSCDSMMKHATINKALLGLMFLLLVTSVVSVNATTTTDDDTTEEETETTSEDETEDEEDGRAIDEAEIDILMTDINGFFSWKESAEIDGVTHQVNSSIHEVTATEQEIYLNYPQGDEIIHDPKIGFENLLLVASTGTGTQTTGNIVDILADNYLPIIAGVAAIAVIGVIVVAKRR